eukprot:scaffold12024_cov142-Isochrysis_galbana.AAC.3
MACASARFEIDPAPDRSSLPGTSSTVRGPSHPSLAQGAPPRLGRTTPEPAHPPAWAVRPSPCPPPQVDGASRSRPP